MNYKAVIRKRNFYLTLFLIAFSFIVVCIVWVYLVVEPYEEMSLYLLLLLFLLLGVILFFRGLLLSYNQLVKVAKVVLKQSPPLPFTTSINQLSDFFQKRGYESYVNHDQYQILFLQVTDNTLKIKKFHKLYLVILLKNQHIDYYDQLIHQDIRRLEDAFEKKKFPNKYMIMAFKAYKNITEKSMQRIGEVVSYQTGKQSYNQINIGLNLDNQLAYFLYSDHYAPNSYYQEAVNIIKEAIK